jgi:hypothetical protein
VPTRAFRNDGKGAFEDVTVAANLGTLAKGHGVAFADIENDGAQDIYEVLGGAFPGDIFPNALFQNPGNGNDWISLKLEGTRANRSAIGARIHVTLAGRTGTRSLFRTVGSGGSFGASPLEQEIGLGCLERRRRDFEIEITWPDRDTRSRSRSRRRTGPARAAGEPAARRERNRLILKAIDASRRRWQAVFRDRRLEGPSVEPT